MAVLWNPAIRKSIAIVVPNVGVWSFLSVVGFGVCPDTKDPKLVMITYIDVSWKIEPTDPIPCQVMVFTLSSGEWKTPCSNGPRSSIEFTCSQTFIGQFIYWFAYDNINVDGVSSNLIMSFDMSTEEFREIDLPDCLADDPQSNMSVSRLRESLVLLAYNYRETTNIFVCDVWMMERDDSKVFTKIFTISAPDLSLPRTLGFRNNGEPIVEMEDDALDFDKPCALVVYEPCSQHFRDLGIRGNMSSFFGSSYTESLLLLNHDDGQIIRC